MWSPDGSRIAFVSNRAGGFPELYLMFADGTGVVRLTTNSLIDANPSWSPDGTKLVFERCCENGTSDLFTIDVATRAEVNVTATAGQEFDPTWSPDGTRIAFVAFEVGQGNIDIWVMNADGYRSDAAHAGGRAGPLAPLAADPRVNDRIRKVDPVGIQRSRVSRRCRRAPGRRP